jgi:hypothetical protein
MSQFTKEKIAFAVALLATIFTITPLVDDFGGRGFVLFGVLLEVKFLFYLISLLLSLSVYFYGIQFITERPIRATEVLGDSFYALAITAPILYGLLFLGARLVAGIAAFAASHAAELITEAFVGVLGSIAAAFLQVFFRRALKRKSQISEASELREQALAFLRRAEEVNSAGLHDLAFRDAFCALAPAARAHAVMRGRSLSKGWIEELRQQLPTSELRTWIDRLRVMRNEKAGGGGESITPDQAREVLSAIRRILESISDGAA